MTSLRRRVAMMLRGEIPPPPVGRTLGFRMLAFSEGTSKFEMDVDETFHNPMGTVHGGIVVGLADSAMGMALVSTLDDSETFTTLELKTNFVRPVYKGKLTAEGRLVHRGRTIAVAEAIVTDEKGKLVAKCTSTCIVLKTDSESTNKTK